MEIKQKHIAFRLVSALIVVILLIPTGLKLVHVFEHQDHPLCTKTDTANFHECELDCVFFKYNIQHHDLKSQNYNINFDLINNFEITSLIYDFYYSYQVLSLSLRGPPALV